MRCRPRRRPDVANKRNGLHVRARRRCIESALDEFSTHTRHGRPASEEITEGNRAGSTRAFLVDPAIARTSGNYWMASYYVGTVRPTTGEGGVIDPTAWSVPSIRPRGCYLRYWFSHLVLPRGG